MNVYQEALNLTTWSKPAVVRELDSLAECTDPGERAALDHIGEEIRGKPILDLGVGTGRTIPILQPLASEYRALDCSTVMVAVCRQRFPGVKVNLCDARDLSPYPSDHFGLVNFAFNGIDAVPLSDRRCVFRAVRGVLRPGGIFLFSALNIEGPSYRERPWRLRVWPTRNPVRAAWAVARQTAGMAIDFGNWLSIRGKGQAGPGFALAPLSAHHYGILAHFTSLARQLDELEEEGFAPGVAVFESRRGRRVALRDDTSKSDWFHFVARRSDTAAA